MVSFSHMYKIKFQKINLTNSSEIRAFSNPSKYFYRNYIYMH